MLTKVMEILGIILAILQIINFSIDVLNKISNRTTNTVVYTLI